MTKPLSASMASGGYPLAAKYQTVVVQPEDRAQYSRPMKWQRRSVLVVALLALAFAVTLTIKRHPMDGLDQFFLLVATPFMALSTFAGYGVMKTFPRRQPAAPIPVARDANPELGYRAHTKLGRFTKTIGRALWFVFGFALFAWPWALIVKILQQPPPESHSKGRVLRIKNRARLPEVLRGPGWEDSVTLELPASRTDRRVLAELWLLTARMEHASIAAFSQLSLQLSVLAAPAALLEWTHRAALDEVRHAKRCFAIASALSGELHCAGPLAELAHADSHAIDHTRLAIGSLVDGCLAEGLAADVAARSAAVAQEPAIRATLQMIAHDEAGHAELAWNVLAWCLDVGGPTVHHAVTARVASLSRELTPRLPDIAGIDDMTLARYGVVSQDVLGELALARLVSVQSRARALLGFGEARAA